MIFIAPGSFDEWYTRLLRRNTENQQDLNLRIKTARDEVKQIGMFDYVVVNRENQIEKTVDDLVAIINAEHLAVNPKRIG